MWIERPGREALIDAVEAAAAAGDVPFEVLLRGARGPGTRVDLVARQPDGSVLLVGVASPEHALLRWAELCGQLAWLAPRLRDWAVLAPERGLRADRALSAWLVSGRFDEAVLAAAETQPAVALIRGGLIDGPTGLRFCWEPEAGVPAGAADPGPTNGRIPCDDGPFRTGLRPEEV